MTPARAKYDRAQVYKDRCHLHSDQTTQGTCVYGDRSASKSIVLFGDSHAAQWFPAVNEQATTRGYRLYSWTKSACPWYEVSVIIPRSKRPYPGCDKWRRAMFTRMAHIKPDVVFVASISETYRVDDQGRVLSRAKSQPFIDQAIVQTLGELQQSASHVVVIADNPHSKVSVPACISAHMNYVRACDLPRPSLESALSTDVSNVSSMRGVQIADFTDRLCWSASCPAVINGYIAYSDRNHLTATFARYASEWFTEYLP